MKRDVGKFISKCMNCQLFKAKQKKPSGLLQPLEIPEWKLEQVSMDFIDGLPRTRSGHDSIWVIVDRLTKSARFIPVKSNRTPVRLPELYVKWAVRFHGIPNGIVSD